MLPPYTPVDISFNNLIDELCDFSLSPPPRSSLAISFDNLIDQLVNTPLEGPSSPPDSPQSPVVAFTQTSADEEVSEKNARLPSSFDLLVKHYSDMHDSMFGSDHSSLEECNGQLPSKCRGRVSKHRQHKEVMVLPSHDQSTTVSRPRGRPLKSPCGDRSEPSDDEAEVPVPKRPRGRPIKRKRGPKSKPKSSVPVNRKGQSPSSLMETEYGHNSIAELQQESPSMDELEMQMQVSDIFPDASPRLSPPMAHNSPVEDAPDVSREEIAGKSRVLSRPAFWTVAYDVLNSLEDKQWIEVVVADFYLTSIWYELQGITPIRYVSYSSIQSLRFNDDPPTNEEIARFMHDYFIPLHQDIPQVPVAFLVHHNAHFFGVIFDYAHSTAYVLGRRVGGEEYDPDWTAWQGPRYWSRIAEFHFWEAVNPDDVMVLTKDWHQNGYDCGPTACAVIQRCMQDGLEMTWQSMMTRDAGLPCGHLLRRRMLQRIREQCLKSYRDYLHLRDYPPLHWSDAGVEEETLDSFAQGGDRLRDDRLLRSLTSASNKCQACSKMIANACNDFRMQQMKTTVTEDPLEEQEIHQAEKDSETVEGECMAEGHSREHMQALMVQIKKHKILHGARNKEARPARAIGAPIKQKKKDSDDVTDDDEEAHPEEDHQRSAAAKTLRKKVTDWHLGTLRRFPRRTPPTSLPAYEGRRFLPHRSNYDEYNHGPTLEMLQVPDVYSIITFPFEHMVQSTPWSMWKDHGYRLLTNAFQMFYLGSPVDVMEHVMTTGNMEDYDPKHRVSNKIPASGEDVEIMSASEMLDYAGKLYGLYDTSQHGHNAFVCGRLPVGGNEEALYVSVDLEKDAVELPSEAIDISIDIDSIIWTTKEFVCRESIGVYLSPAYDTKPGIAKHNHVYVDILIPQSEFDQTNLGERTEWLSKKFPMTAIPHTLIGRVGSASGHDLAVYIMFPRMIHRNPMNGRRMNLMPKGVLDPFWEEVFLPAISEHARDSWTPYMSQTLAETIYKNRRTGDLEHGGRRGKTLPLSNSIFLDVQDSMRRIIEDNEDLLSMYGSFFFVVEGKGIKLLSKDGQDGVHESPEAALRRNISCLDWTTMLDRRKGELIVDVGISFTPKHDEPLCGLWRLDALEESYGAAGFNRGTIHHQCMLLGYGALQAEMNYERSLQTHVAFRSTYNLYYEAVRTTSNVPVFAKDSDAYNLTPRYFAESSGAVKMFEKAKGRTYGVRDEYRVSGQAARILLREIIPKASIFKYMESNPVLWIPSKVWFGFMARRVLEVQRTQLSLSKRNPPNLGTMTGILNHMLRCVTSTPIVYDYHVRESLALLEHRNVVERANMFFLQDLNVHMDPCMDAVQEVDDARVLALMGLNAKARRDKALASRNRGAYSILDQTALFPIGAYPTWNVLKQAISNNPGLMFKDWTFSQRFYSVPLFVSRLFCNFTKQIWMMVVDDAFKAMNPSPTNLQDAMKCWTVISIDDTLHNTVFEATNVGLENAEGTAHGRQGPRSTAFFSRMETYFPSSDAPFHPKSMWHALWQNQGYIKEYHDYLMGKDGREQFELNDLLASVFAELQCLPASQKMTRKTKGYVWKITQQSYVFATNPKFYKIEGLGKDSVKRTNKPAAHRPRRGIKSRKVFEEDLWRSSGFDGLANKRDETDRQKRRRLQKRMSAANKNKRKPPPPHPRQTVASDVTSKEVRPAMDRIKKNLPRRRQIIDVVPTEALAAEEMISASNTVRVNKRKASDCSQAYRRVKHKSCRDTESESEDAENSENLNDSWEMDDDMN